MKIVTEIQRKIIAYSRGFTVLEMLVSISIMAIIAAIGIPSYLSYLPTSRLNGVTRIVMADIMEAKMKAVNQNTITRIFCVNSYEYKICDDANGDGTVANGEGDVIVKNIQSEYPNIRLLFTRDPVCTPIYP